MLFINGLKFLTAQVPNDSPTTVPFTQDNVVRDFHDWPEARAYAVPNTDYIGNLLPASTEPGTWVRFSNVGLNIVGEQHDYVTLNQITAAVRSNSFVYEQFATDTLTPGSHFRAAYLVENNALLQAYGVNLNGNLAAVGGESLLPKIAYVIVSLVPYFNGTTPLQGLTSGNGRYSGKPFQRYLKIGWAWAKDLAANPVTVNDNALAQAVNNHTNALDGFITGLVADHFLGDALVQNVNANKIQPLLAVCQAFLPVLIERAHGDPGITLLERQALAQMPIGTLQQQFAMFGLWRNLYFASATANAAAQGVRYAGMGDNHRLWLIQNNRVPPNAHLHSVTPTNFQAVVNRTNVLQNS
jgi:hypothetical protein